MRTELFVALAAALVSACDGGPPNAPAGCAVIAHAWCHRIWELSSQGCADAEGIAASFESEQQCESDFEFEGVSCPQSSCVPKGYSPSHANDCASAAGDISCSPDIALAGFSCGGMCCELAGAEVSFSEQCCSGSAHETPGFSCGPSFSVPPSLVCD